MNQHASEQAAMSCRHAGKNAGLFRLMRLCRILRLLRTNRHLMLLVVGLVRRAPLAGWEDVI